MYWNFIDIRSSVSVKRNIKIPPRTGAVVDVDINPIEQDRIEITPDDLWLSMNLSICTYLIIADLSEKSETSVAPFIIVNFNPTEYLHLSKNQVVAFTKSINKLMTK